MVEQSRTGTRATVDSSSLLRMATAACPDSLRSKLLVGVAQLSPRHRLRQLIHQWLKLPHLRPRIDATSAWSAGAGLTCTCVSWFWRCYSAARLKSSRRNPFGPNHSTLGKFLKNTSPYNMNPKGIPLCAVSITERLGHSIAGPQMSTVLLSSTCQTSTPSPTFEWALGLKVKGVI